MRDGRRRHLTAWMLLCMLWGGLAAGVRLRGGALEWFALVVLTGIMALGAAAPRLSVRRLQVERTVQWERPVSGGELPVELTFRSALIMPFIWIAVRDEARNETNRSGKPAIYRRVVLPWLGREFTVRYFLRPLRRGELRFQPVVVTVGDLFGLSARQIKLACESAVLVLPEPVREERDLKLWNWSVPRVTGGGQTVPSISGEDGSRNRTGSQAGTGQELRAYAAGDPLRYLDWRSMAKGRGLKTRCVSPEAPYDRIIALDCSEASYGKDERLFDVCVSRALWGIEQACGEGVGVRLYCGGNEKPDLQTGRERTGRNFPARAAARLAKVRADGKEPLDGLLHKALQTVPRGATLICVSSGAGDWKSAALLAASRRCRLELWLTVNGKSPSYSLRERIREWEQYGCRIRLWMLPAEEEPLTEAWEGGVTDEDAS